MIRKLLFLFACAATTVGAWAQTGTYGTDPNTATISASENTLTITGKGDLTQIGFSYSFVSSKQTELFTKDAYDQYVQVAWDAVYDSEAPYFKKNVVYTIIDEDFESLYTTEKTDVHYNYSTSKDGYDGGLYFKNVWFGDRRKVEDGEKLDFSLIADGKTMYGRLADDNITYLTVEEVKALCNEVESEPYKVLANLSQNVYESTDGVNYTGRSNGAPYNSSARYYTKTEPYDGPLNVDQLVAGGYIKGKSLFVEALQNAIQGGTYTDVAFVQDGGDITIDSEIIKNILYNTTNNTANTNIVTLDLGQTTCKDLEEGNPGDLKGSFALIGSTAVVANLNLTTLTLPKVAYVGDGETKTMTVPANVLAGFALNTNTKFTNVVVPEGYTHIGASAFNTLPTIIDVTLPSTLKEIGDHAFYNCSTLKRVNATTTHDVTFPVNLETIGEFAFAQCGIEADENKPLEFLGSESGGSIKNIMAGAFSSILSIKYIIFREGVEFIGNSAFSLPSEIAKTEEGVQRTITFPNTVKYIGPGAFEFRMFEDIYFKSTTAPLCPMGYPLVTGETPVNAFYEVLHMGNNGFQEGPSEKIPLADKAKAEGYANRENYRDSGYRYFTILHYPDNLTPAQEATYKDITRVYETYGQGTPGWSAANTVKETKGLETETLKGYNNTDVYKVPDVGYLDTYDQVTVWPSQSQWMRAYGTVYNGVNWNGISKYRPELTQDLIDLMIKDNLSIKVEGITDPVTLTGESTISEAAANTYNSQLPGAKHAGDPISYYEFQYEVDEANMHIDGAITAGTVYYSEKEINDHNEGLPTAVHAGEIEIPAVPEQQATYWNNDEVVTATDGKTYDKTTVTYYPEQQATYYTDDELLYIGSTRYIKETLTFHEQAAYTKAEMLELLGGESQEWQLNNIPQDEGGNYLYSYYTVNDGSVIYTGQEKTPYVAAYYVADEHSVEATSGGIKTPYQAAQPEVLYTQETANAHNRGIQGAWNETTIKGTYTEEQAIAYNNALPNAVKIGSVKETWTESDANIENAKLSGAKIAGTQGANYIAYYDQLSMDAYQGTRRFVIGSGDTKQTASYPIDVKGGNWWTICVPFNMTKAMIDEVFGEGTNVCLFSGVERVNTATKKQITLKFQNDVYLHKTIKETYMDGGKQVTEYQENFDKEGAAVSDPDDIVIYAHESYMIYPKKKNDDAVYVVPKYRPITGNPIPTILTSTGESTDDPMEYRFVGNYNDSKIPEFSYFYAKKSGDADYKFWFAQNGNIKWKPNKSVVQSQDRQGGTLDNKEFFGGQPETERAKQVSLFGFDSIEDDDLTTEVTIIAGDGENSSVVYNLNGQVLNPTMLRTGQVYIKNGKKFISK